MAKSQKPPEKKTEAPKPLPKGPFKLADGQKVDFEEHPPEQLQTAVANMKAAKPGTKHVVRGGGPGGVGRIVAYGPQLCHCIGKTGVNLVIGHADIAVIEDITAGL